MQKFSNGERVRWREGEAERTGIVTNSDVDPPPEAGGKAGNRFHRVTAADGTSYVISESDLEPTDASPEA